MKRLTALPRISNVDIPTLRREYRKLKDKRKDTSVIHRILTMAVARKIRREVRAEQQA
jgi:hypothetical protein